FAVRLDDFVLERFPPVLLLVTDQGNGFSIRRGEVLLGPNAHEHINDLDISIIEWLAQAALVNGIPQPYLDAAAGPAARVRVSNQSGSKLAEGWLHALSVFGDDLYLTLPDGRTLHMEQPRPRKFLSKATIFAIDEQPEVVAIQVNQPYRRDGWMLYQLSYDERLGPASRRSTLEAVEDRVLPTLYIGIGLLLLGVLMHLWRPRSLGTDP
ncbi:MAG: hypothetical protein AAB263_14240, partial [Planctomycetota bacterium]